MNFHRYTMLDGCSMTVIDMTAYKRNKRYGHLLRHIQPVYAFAYRWWLAFKEAVAVFIMLIIIAAIALPIAFKSTYV